MTHKHVYRVAKKRLYPSAAQWRHLPYILSKTERRIYRVAMSLLVLSLLFSGWGFYFTNRISVPGVGGEYTEGLVGGPQLINPIFASENNADSDLTKLVFRGLFTWNPTEGLIPDVATGYQISEDGLTYTIPLRNDVLWHDGTPLTARDVVFTFQSIENPQLRSPLEITFRGVAVSAIDDQTVTFTLGEPFAPFLSSLTVGILPAHVWEGVNPRRMTLSPLNLEPIGNGPYQFSRFVKDQNGGIHTYQLKRFDRFYGEQPKIDLLTFKFYANQDEAFNALTNRNIEGLAFIPIEQIDGVERVRGTNLFHPSIPQQTAIFFNDARNTALADLDIRDALNRAISREEIVKDVYQGEARVLSGPFLLDTFVEQPPAVEQDLDRARELLEDAGWTLPEGATFRVSDSDEADDVERLSIELVTSEDTDMIAIAEHVKRAWEAIGVEVTIRSDDSFTYQTTTLPSRQYDALLTGLLFGADPDPFPFWHSSQSREGGLNLAGYTNRKADEQIEIGRGTTNETTRKTAYEALQGLILGDVPAVFLIQPNYTYATSSKIQGVSLERIINPSDRFNTIENWYIRTKKVFKLGN